MASDPTASRPSAAEGRACADALRVDEQPGKEKTGSDSTPPRAGRTGSHGAKAERPAENRARKSGDGTTDPERGGKPPSPAANETQPDDPSCPSRDSGG